MKHLPNILTIGRILLTPVFVLYVLDPTFESRTIALFVFVIAAISDYWDGELARRYNYKSRIGQFLDPFADKVLVLSAFIVIPVVYPGIIPWVAVGLIAVRDVVLTGLRVWEETQGRPVTVMPLAQTKTAFQLTYLILILLLFALIQYGDPVEYYAQWLLDSFIVTTLMWATVAITVYTGAMYFVPRKANQEAN